MKFDRRILIVGVLVGLLVSCTPKKQEYEIELEVPAQVEITLPETELTAPIFFSKVLQRVV